MASWREIDDTKKNPAGAQFLASRLLKFSREGLTEWEIDFLESITRRTNEDELSTRQAEKLLQIRDDVERVTICRGFSVKRLIALCYEARLDLDEQDEAWIAELRTNSPDRIRRRLLGRLFRCARGLNLIDSDWAA